MLQPVARAQTTAQKSAQTASIASNVSRKSEENAERRELLLVAGLQTVLDIEFKPCTPIEECIKVINAQVVTVQFAPEKKQLIFTPIKNGETTVSLRDEAGDIRLILKTIVSDSNLARAAREIKTLLQDVEGVDVKILGNRIVVDGEVLIPGDLERVYAVLADESYKSMVLNLLTVSPLGQKILAKRVQDEINNGKVTVRVQNGTFILEGVVDSVDEARRAEKILVNMLPPKVEINKLPENIQYKRPKSQGYINLIRVARRKPAPPPKLVRMTVNFVELAKNYARNFGFNWQPGLTSGGTFSFGPSTTGGVTSESNGALAGTISNLFPKLTSAQTAGYVRVLQETHIVSQSKKQGRVKRVSRVPVATVDAIGNQVFSPVEAGLDLKITPTINQDESIALNLEFSFSNIVGFAEQGAPLTSSSDYTGTVSLKSNESAAVVNLISNDITTDFNKIPQSRDNPIFSLIRSKAFNKNKSQFVIFVTPTIIESAATGTEDIKKKYGIRRR
jgi:pilus assembly protein CpaC